MTDKEKYRSACRSEDSIPLTSRDWWLDAVAGEDAWDVAVVEKGDEVVASLPYCLKRKLGFKLISMPLFTPSLGVWIKYPDGQKYTTRLSHEMRLCSELLDRLPEFHRFNQRFHHSVTNWLPFYWNGFRQTTRYTYIIKDLTDLDSVYSGFRENVRRNIRKAKKKLRVFEVDEINELLHLIDLTFSRQEVDISDWRPVIRKIEHACAERDRRRILLARDEEDRVHAGLLLVWDENAAYNLSSGVDPEHLGSGAMTLLLWHAIQLASTVSRSFDFEGSMVREIERFFRSFGGEQTPYFAIHKNRGMLRILDAVRV